MEKLIRKDYSLGEVVTIYPAVVKKFNDMESVSYTHLIIIYYYLEE